MAVVNGDGGQENSREQRQEVNGDRDRARDAEGDVDMTRNDEMANPLLTALRDVARARGGAERMGGSEMTSLVKTEGGEESIIQPRQAGTPVSTSSATAPRETQTTETATTVTNEDATAAFWHDLAAYLYRHGLTNPSRVRGRVERAWELW